MSRSNPQQEFLNKAQESVEKAVKQGEELTRELQKRGVTYRDLASGTQEELKGLLGEGQDPASYYARITSGFGELPSMPQQIATYQTQLNQGDYPVLGSPSHQRFEDTLTKSADLYKQYISSGLDETQKRYGDIARNAAFNLQLDPSAMRMAQGNIDTQGIKAGGYMTYNV